MARRGLFALYGAQWRLVGRRRALRFHQQPQLSRAAGTQWSHASAQPRDGRRRCFDRPPHRRANLRLGERETMEPFVTWKAIAAPFDQANIDTNQLCPTRFNKVEKGPKYASVLFHDLRFHTDGSEKADFILNR